MRPTFVQHSVRQSFCRVLGLSLLICISPGLSAGVNDYIVHTWRSEEGLPQNKVSAVVQTHDGYLWVGTYSGLARFDGIRFDVFDDINTPELHNSRITSLFEAADNTLWIGHENGEVTRFKDGKFEAVSLRVAWRGGKILEIGADETGDVWLVNEDGLLARAKDGLVLIPQAGPATRLVTVARSARGAIWVSREGQVSALEQARLRPIDFPAPTTNGFVQGIGARRSGGLWLMHDQRIKWWEEGREAEDLGPAPWGTSAVLNLLELHSGSLAIATSDLGLYLVQPGKEILQFNRANGFPSDWVTALCEDREGNIWVGTGTGGLVMLRARNIKIVAPPDQWQGRPVLTVAAGREGTLWVGTEGAGLYRFANGVWSNYGAEAGFGNPYVWSVGEDAQGQVWAGTWYGLLARRGERFERPEGVDQTVGVPVFALQPGHDGGLWVGTAAGLLHRSSDRTTWLTQQGEIQLRDVVAAVEDTDSAVWLGMSSGGLCRLQNGALLQFRRENGLASDSVRCLHLDETGALWIGTSGGGISRLKNGRFAAVGRKQGLHNGVICDIQDDGRGFFWLSSHGGIMRVSKAELDRCADGGLTSVHCTTYGMSDGMPTLECSGGLQPAGCRTQDGRLWFPTTKGLVMVDPANVRTNLLPPPVVIEEMLVDGHPMEANLDSTPVLKIPPGRHRVEFRFAGLSFAAPEKVRFKCQLEGMESGWVDNGTQRVAPYNYIPPGNYVFRVAACNNDEVWNEHGAALSFTVLPFFWQTVSFRVFGGILMVAAGGAVVWLDARRRTRRKLERLERQRAIERERARISKDIHDDLGASLTRITLLSQSARGDLENPEEAAADLDRIYSTARELTRAMDEIVWAVNPKHDTLDSLASYLGRFAQEFLGVANLSCRLDVPVQLPAWPMTSEVRHNLFLAIKEALNNVVKHASAREVRVLLALQAQAFTLSIEDDGCGFYPDKAASGTTDGDRLASGNGLGNMRRRVEEIGGRFEIESAPGRGTKVVFVVAVNRHLAESN